MSPAVPVVSFATVVDVFITQVVSSLVSLLYPAFPVAVKVSTVNGVANVLAVVGVSAIAGLPAVAGDSIVTVALLFL